MNLEEIKKAIREWSIVRTSPESVLTYLKQGCCFKIERSKFKHWSKNSPKSLHVYPGIFDGVLKFILIDSESDKDPSAHKDAISVQNYHKGLSKSEEGFIDKARDGGITVTEALKKMQQWNLFEDAWVYDAVLTEDGIFKAFVVPFVDLTSQFEGSSIPENVVFFGLNNNKVDLIFWGLDTAVELTTTSGALKLGENGIPVEDLIASVPPFGEEGLGLL